MHLLMGIWWRKRLSSILPILLQALGNFEAYEPHEKQECVIDDFLLVLRSLEIEKCKMPEQRCLLL
jgi:hypothetical protein